MAAQSPLFVEIINQIVKEGVCTITVPTLSQPRSLGLFWFRLGPNIEVKSLIFECFLKKKECSKNPMMIDQLENLEYNLQLHHITNRA